MTEINWNNFKAKFNGKETSVFENFAYLLFCKEYKRSIGIFGYRNQAGIEKEPIQEGDECIGFQAKYFESKIDKAQIISSVKTAKNSNPGLTKILLYTNLEFSESSDKDKKEPKSKSEIEKAANEIGINLDWRVRSNFEKLLSEADMQHLASYYFSSNPSLIEYIEGFESQTESILYTIHNSITYNGQSIAIDRKELSKQISETLSNGRISILTGDGGCGKTAIIKDYYNAVKLNTPMYVFKASQFNVTNIDAIFSKANFGISDFIKYHADSRNKVAVIDSAERLSELADQDAARLFLSELLRNSWRVIITIRKSYLDDFKNDLIETFRQPYDIIPVDNLTRSELHFLSIRHKFAIPKEEKLHELITNMFYLGEYLSSYQNLDKHVDYFQFKNTLWGKKVQNTTVKKDNRHIEREKGFLSLTKQRCETGLFFILPDGVANAVLADLLKDEIIGYDSTSGGYFIAHDIYEEWALEKIIDFSFAKSLAHADFLKEIGNSLPMRRAFRHWLSGRLESKPADIQPFINSALQDSQIEKYWRDELIIAVLLSEYSDRLFALFDVNLFNDDHRLMKRIVFLLRIACKEIDDSLSHLFGKGNMPPSVPKGSGWKSTINFITCHSNQYDLKNIGYVLPLFQDWMSHNSAGNASRQIGIFCLNYYDQTQYTEAYVPREIENALLKLVLNSVKEIKTELKPIIDDILKKDQYYSSEPYYDLCNKVLTSLYENLYFLRAFTSETFELANLLWLRQVPVLKDPDDELAFISAEDPLLGTEIHYGLSRRMNSEYSPPSAFQSPILNLLHIDYEQTIKFIIELMNRAVICYANSQFDKRLETLEFVLEDGKKIEVYCSRPIWCMYRGVEAPASPYLLQSIHMALERYLLDLVKKNEPGINEKLHYILSHSHSASLTGVVASIVMANHEDLFDVAKILFSCSKAFRYDNNRLHNESQAKSLYGMMNGINPDDGIHERERNSSCDDPHRRKTLEQIIIQYQFFKSETTSDETADRRASEIYALIDTHKLTLDHLENEDALALKHLLSRIDRRMMNPKVEEQNGKNVIFFNPSFDEDVLKFSQKAEAELNEKGRFIALSLWADAKLKGSEDLQKYESYNSNVELVISETKEILEILNSDDDVNYLAIDPIPAYTCAVLIKCYAAELSEDDWEFCRNVILSYAIEPLGENYMYQISDGVEVAINSVPLLLEHYPEEKETFLLILIFVLFDSYPIGQYKRVCDYVVETLNIHAEKTEKYRVTILMAYLRYKPKFTEISGELRAKVIGYGRISRVDALNIFDERFGSEIEHYLSSIGSLSEFSLDSLNHEDLGNAFQLIPANTKDTELLTLAEKIIWKLSAHFIPDDREARVDYSARNRFLTAYSNFVLHRELHDVERFVRPFIINFSVSDHQAQLFLRIIHAQDRLGAYEQFWHIWEQFYPAIKAACAGKLNSYRMSEIVHKYLLGFSGTTKMTEWHSIKEREKLFYQRVGRDMGSQMAVLDSLAQVLCSIGSSFLSEGVFWITDIIKDNPVLEQKEFETNTMYYLETLARKYINLHRNALKTDSKKKSELVILLSFLIDRGSIAAYSMRESII